MHLLEGMGIALELMAVPVALLVAIALMAVWANLSVGSILLGILLVATVIGVVIMLARLEWRFEEDDGVHEATGESRRAKPQASVAAASNEASVAATSNEVAESALLSEERVDESTPTSDPPAWVLGQEQPSETRHRPG